MSEQGPWRDEAELAAWIAAKVRAATAEPPQPYDYAAAWRAKAEQAAAKRIAAEPVEVRLPSGLRVRARPVPLLALMRAGRVPSGLQPIVDGWIGAATGRDPMAAVAAIQAAIQAKPDDFAAFLLFVWRTCVVAPRFVETAREAAELGLPTYDDIDAADAVALFTWAQGMRPWWGDEAERPADADGADGGDPVAAVAAFPGGEPAGGLGVAPGRDGVRPGPGGDDRPGPGELAGVAGPPRGPFLGRVGGRPAGGDGAGAGQGAAVVAQG